MSKDKKETVKETIDRIADKEIPAVMECIMADAELTTEEKVTILGLLDTAMHHLKLVQAGLE